VTPQPARGQIREELGQIALAEERYRKVVVLETDNPFAVDAA